MPEKDEQTLAGAIERLQRHHPLQYGYRGNEIVFDPGDDPTVQERYNRCPVCEQWSPCDVRVLLRHIEYRNERSNISNNMSYQ